MRSSGMCSGKSGGGHEFLRNGVTAHRGNSSKFPENTMPAFESALETGADWIELDVQKTRDGRLVVIHDDTTGRVGDMDLRVSDSSYSELQKVSLDGGLRIPLLGDVLALVKTQKRTRLSMQPKAPVVGDIAGLVRRLGAEDWIGFNDGGLELMREARSLVPSAPVFFDVGDADIDDVVAAALENRFECVVVESSQLDESKAAKLHGNGLEVGVWTVNERRDMEHFFRMGVDRVYTDFSEMCLKIWKGV